MQRFANVCQNCGSIVRAMNSKCSGCGIIVTKFSGTGLLEVADEMAPNAVALKDPPQLAEKMISSLQGTRKPARQFGDFFTEVMSNVPLTDEGNGRHAAEKKDEPAPPAVRTITPAAFYPPVETVASEVEDNKNVQDLMARLVESQMSPALPAAHSFFDNTLNKPPDEVGEPKSDFEKGQAEPKTTAAGSAKVGKGLTSSSFGKTVVIVSLMSVVAAAAICSIPKQAQPPAVVPQVESPGLRYLRRRVAATPTPAQNQRQNAWPNQANRFRQSERRWFHPQPKPAVQDNDNFLAKLFESVSRFFWNESEPAAAQFLRILAACILFGIAVVQISLKFFGMHGLLNKWEREKYIPNSVLPQHLKLMKELGAGKQRGSLLLGERAEWQVHQIHLPRSLYLSANMRQRNPHVLVMGAGAKGKTRLLASMIIGDIKSHDRAVVVVDSDGSLVELVLRWFCSTADGRKFIDRVRVIDPCREECKLGFNPLSVAGGDNLQIIANSVVMGFKSIYTETQNQQNQWTQQTANILRNALLVLMLNDRTLQDLPTLLSDNDFRDVLLQKIEQARSSEWKTLIDAWSNYKRLARTEQWINWIEPILNRVQPLLADHRISSLLNSVDNCVDLAQVIEDKRILLVRVPDGQLEKGGNLLGSLIVTGLRQAGLAHFEKTHEASSPCSLYLDEMNNFIDSEAFEAICSDTRKLNIGIHGTLKSLQDIPEEYRNRALLNFGAMALFSISKKDADILGPTMFRVDGRKIKKINLRDVVNQINSSPSMDLASDEEKININRLIGQPERSYFCHLVGTEAGVFRIKAPEIKDIARGDVNWDLMESLFENRENEEDE